MDALLFAYLRYVPGGLLVAAPVAIAGGAGYALLVRTRFNRVGFVGTALGVVAVIGTAVVGGSVVSNANSRSFETAAGRDAAYIAAVSSVFVASVSDIHVKTLG